MHIEGKQLKINDKMLENKLLNINGVFNQVRAGRKSATMVINSPRTILDSSKPETNIYEDCQL
jgi:hypothetical protein